MKGESTDVSHLLLGRDEEKSSQEESRGGIARILSQNDRMDSATICQ